MPWWQIQKRDYRLVGWLCLVISVVKPRENCSKKRKCIISQGCSMLELHLLFQSMCCSAVTTFMAGTHKSESALHNCTLIIMNVHRALKKVSWLQIYAKKTGHLSIKIVWHRIVAINTHIWAVYAFQWQMV